MQRAASSSKKISSMSIVRKFGALFITCPLVGKWWCINVLGTLWVRDMSWMNQEMVNHERIHTAQQRELLFVPFYVIYGLEWLYRLVTRRRGAMDAYRNISFEREAYGHGENLAYLPRRRHYAQWRR